MFLQLFSVLWLIVYSNAQLPSFIESCSRKSNIGDCIKRNILIAKPYMEDGIPELFVERLKPMLLPDISMDMPIQMRATNLYVWHYEKFIVKKVKFDLNRGIFDIVYNLPVLGGQSDYTMKGTLFWVFNIDSSGIATGNISDVDVFVKFRGTKQTKDGKQYMSFNQTGFRFVIHGKANAHFTNIFPNMPWLASLFDFVLNWQAKNFMYIITPLFNDIIAGPVKKAVFGVFSAFSLDELFES